MRTLLLGSLLLLATSAQAQQASYTFFGSWQGCPTGEPHFNVIGVPRIGGSFVVETEASCHGSCGVASGYETWIFTGVSNTRFGSWHLPFDLNVFSINLPGSLKGATESLEAILPALPHALEKLRGTPADCGA